MFNSSTTYYNPSEKDRNQLIDEFVVRTDSFETIFNAIKSSRNKEVRRHFLIVGQRGSGKTTLLYRLKYAFEDDGEIAKSVIALNLGEEQYAISELHDLWETIGGFLDDFHGYSHLTNEIIRIRDNNQAESKSWEILFNALVKRNQTVLLLIDNLGDLLKKFSKDEIIRFKEVLTNSGVVGLIAGTPYTLESVFDFQESFFDFFSQIHLEGLSQEEVITLLKRLGESHERKGLMDQILENRVERIETLRRLTGGVIRTMVLLFKVFIENSTGKAIRDLQSVLDSVTPLYKHRMDDLPTQQQKIVDAVAKKWDAIGVKEISSISRISSKNVSAQLRQLEKNQMIEKISTDSKNHLYQLKERFFNIWYLMRYGRRYDRERVLWLVRFLETWCDRRELENRVIDHIENLTKSDNYDKSAALLIGEAYLACQVDSEVKERLIDVTASRFPEDFDSTNYDLTHEKFSEAITLFEDGKKKESKEKLKGISVSELNYPWFLLYYLKIGNNKKLEEVVLQIDAKGCAISKDFVLIGKINHDNESYDSALKFYSRAIELDRTNEEAIFAKANILSNYFDKHKEAESCLMEFIQRVPEKKGRYYHELAHIEVRRRNFARAESYFKKSNQYGDKEGMLCLGVFYHFEMQAFIKAEEIYLEVAQYDDRANSFLGILYLEDLNEYEKAIKYFEKALEGGENEAYFQLGRIYNGYVVNEEKAIDFFEKAISVGDKRAYHPLAHIYSYSKTKQDKLKAEKYFEKAIESGDSFAGPCLAEFYMNEDRDQKKELILELLENGKKQLPNEMVVYEQSAKINLSFGYYDTTFSDLEKIVSDSEYLESELGDITEIFIELISRGQYEPVLSFFTNSKFDLKTLMKPLYYALMAIMKDKYPNEYLKMGKELAETVSEILREIDQRSSENKNQQD